MGVLDSLLASSVISCARMCVCVCVCARARAYTHTGYAQRESDGHSACAVCLCLCIGRAAKNQQGAKQRQRCGWCRQGT